MIQANKETIVNTYPKGLAIGYCRVSTALQETEGYSMEAQEGMIKEYARRNGYELLDTYCEQESGRKSDRDIVNKVVNLCSSKKATLIIARLDRFTRDLHFLTTVQKRKDFKFVAIDNPSADNLVIQIMVSIAENESNIISKRTKSALAVAKAKGIDLGNHQTLISNYHRFERRNDELWDLFIEVRKAWSKAVKEHEHYEEFIRWIEDCYDVVETKWEWEEYIKLPHSKLFGVKTDYELEGDFWEELAFKLKPENLFGNQGLEIYKNDNYRVHVWDAFGIANKVVRTTEDVILLPILDRKPLAKASKKELAEHKQRYPRHHWGTVDFHFFRPSEIELEGFKLPVNQNDVHTIWGMLSGMNTKIATESRVQSARDNAVETYKPYIDDARAKGIKGIRGLGRYLEEERVPTPKGNIKWAPSSVESVLRLLKAHEANLPLTGRYERLNRDSFIGGQHFNYAMVMDYWDFIRTGKNKNWARSRGDDAFDTYRSANL